MPGRARSKWLTGNSTAGLFQDLQETMDMMESQTLLMTLLSVKVSLTGPHETPCVFCHLATSPALVLCPTDGKEPESAGGEG